MNISIVGAGYVGLVTGACLADAGNNVLCLDLDETKIKILREGGIPIHEPGLLEMVRKNVSAANHATMPPFTGTQTVAASEGAR
ncbi:hypothetical protein EBZ80_27095 [bacterium]|nr:hypothetical protein [bacterium]